MENRDRCEPLLLRLPYFPYTTAYCCLLLNQVIVSIQWSHIQPNSSRMYTYFKSLTQVTTHEATLNETTTIQINFSSAAHLNQ